MRFNEQTVLGGIPDIMEGLDAVESAFPSSRSATLPLLSMGTLITIQTRNTCYRMQVVDGPARRVLIVGGKLFPEDTEVEVVGAADDECVRIGWIVEGLQLELATIRGRVLTSIVQSLSVVEQTYPPLASSSLP